MAIQPARSPAAAQHHPAPSAWPPSPSLLRPRCFSTPSTYEPKIKPKMPCCLPPVDQCDELAGGTDLALSYTSTLRRMRATTAAFVITKLSMLMRRGQPMCRARHLRKMRGALDVQVSKKKSRSTAAAQLVSDLQCLSPPLLVRLQRTVRLLL